ncbi:hypothetical protein [Streptomyces liangshanensis]|uniref:Uncharacterized protein n=1 Tax=Streptomyces liangshanensis TaxID=2717324 RepID=A0A6G9GZ30_9ACTN|nr:hypothetical protein [Streptomyces liangshanensis]QIQ03528.1 hypothetical protein HA039_15375 [Streptomyces liangshanensis]
MSRSLDDHRVRSVRMYARDRGAHAERNPRHTAGLGARLSVFRQEGGQEGCTAARLDPTALGLRERHDPAREPYFLITRALFLDHGTAKNVLSVDQQNPRVAEQ